ncbi:beta-galactosidase [Qipengyuania sp. GH29]|nr:beta-galactosidase [Qipengyuania sphaerica]
MHLGVCYYPEHWPEARWAEDARLMRETGLTRVRIGEFAWSRIEPEPGLFDWGWLDRAVDTLHEAGLGIIMGTPTATPPKWLVDRMPDMIALDREGKPRGFGSRRHYCFSHEGYRAEAARITREVAARYGGHPGVVSWQTDNEYGCHDTVQSFSPAARDAFRAWLEERYGDIARLNEAWGNVFWSMEYRSFEEVELPNLTVTEANPAHWLAFRRFSSDQVVSFNRAQVEILRDLSPGRDITHNAMGFYTGYDHHDLCDDLDVLGWDSYPLGFLEMFRFTEEEKRTYARQGHPDIAAFHHDLYRGCAKGGRWSVLEQQPGPVNWARYNPAPLPGMVKLWTLEAFAHGAEMVSYFRWRQFPKAQEQMHAGLLRPDGNPAPALAEAREAANILSRIDPIAETPKQTAIVFSYESEWITQIQPQGEGYSALWTTFGCYSALRQFGHDIDIVPPTADLDAYSLVVVPCLPIVPEDLTRKLEAFEGQIVIGPRTGSRTEEFAIPDDLPPGPLGELVGGRIILSETLSPRMSGDPVRPGEGRWIDHYEGAAEAEVTDGEGVVISRVSGNVRLLCCWPDKPGLSTVLAAASRDAGLPSECLPEGIRKRTRGDLAFKANYLTGDCAWLSSSDEDLPKGGG